MTAKKTNTQKTIEQLASAPPPSVRVASCERLIMALGETVARAILEQRGSTSAIAQLAMAAVADYVETTIADSERTDIITSFMSANDMAMRATDKAVIERQKSASPPADKNAN